MIVWQKRTDGNVNDMAKLNETEKMMEKQTENECDIKNRRHLLFAVAAVTVRLLCQLSVISSVVFTDGPKW